MTGRIDPDYVVLIEGRGYVQPNLRLGPLETARTFPDAETACRAAVAFLNQKGRDGWTAEAIRKGR